MSRTGSNGALTLIELLLSVAILASAVTLILQALVQGASASALTRSRLSAYAFSSAKLADLELSFDHGVVPRPAGTFHANDRQFQWRVDTSPLPDDPQLELVTLTVSWPQGAHRYASRVSTVRRAAEPPP